MTSEDRLRAELRSLEEAAPADLPPMPAAPQPPRWRRLALPAAVMVVAGTLIGLSLPAWLPGALPFGPRLGELVPVPTTPPAPSGMPQFCMQAYMEGRLVRHEEYGFAVAHGDLNTPVRWPSGYVAREGTDGLELLDEEGEVVAREGDFVAMGGGGNDMWIACPGPEVIPPEFTGRLEGDADMEDGCIWLRTESGRRWPIAWPDAYRQEFRDGQPVLLRDGEVVAEAGDAITVRGAPGDVGYACIGFSSYVATEVVAISSNDPGEPSAAPSAGLTHVAAKSMSFVLPNGWTYRLPDRVWGSDKFIFFSNQPMHEECERTEDEHGVLTRCGLPIDQLVSGGILVDWWNMSWYWLPSPPPLPKGTPYAVGARDGVRESIDVDECQGLSATHAEMITLPGTSHLRICARDPSDRTREELEALLQSIVFDELAEPSPTAPFPPADDDPEEITGILRGDRAQGIDCIWLTDPQGNRWEVIWPTGYRQEVVEGVATLSHEGQVVAVAGNTITVRGARSREFGSVCMIGIVYEAAEVIVE